MKVDGNLSVFAARRSTAGHLDADDPAPFPRRQEN